MNGQAVGTAVSMGAGGVRDTGQAMGTGAGNGTAWWPLESGIAMETDGPVGLTSSLHTWRAIRAMCVRTEIGETAFRSPAHHTLLINVGPPFKLEEQLGGRVYRTHGAPGGVAVIPAGMATACRTRERRPQLVECLLLHLDPAALRDVAAGAGVNPDSVALTGVMGGHDPVLEHLGRALLANPEQGSAGALLADTLTTAIAVQLLRDHTNSGGRVDLADRAGAPAGLAPAVLRRTFDYIEDNLAGDLTLPAIAGAVHLSPFHFARVFKQATGRSPHQYVTERRIARAKHLLTATALPLHEVASRAGFADQSHLTRQFRRNLGATPAALRALAG